MTSSALTAFPDRRGRSLQAQFQGLLGIQKAEKLDQIGHQAVRLMAGTESGSIVTVEALTKEDGIAPVRIALFGRRCRMHTEGSIFWTVVEGESSNSKGSAPRMQTIKPLRVMVDSCERAAGLGVGRRRRAAPFPGAQV